MKSETQKNSNDVHFLWSNTHRSRFNVISGKHSGNCAAVCHGVSHKGTDEGEIFTLAKDWLCSGSGDAGVGLHRQPADSLLVLLGLQLLLQYAVRAVKIRIINSEPYDK